MRAGRWMAPTLAVLAVTILYPLVRIIWTSLHRDQATVPDDHTFVGLRNYTDLIGSGDWWLAVATTLALVVSVVLVQVVLGVLFGTALDRMGRLWPITQVLALVPLALLSVVNVVGWRAAVDGGFVDRWFDLGDSGSLVQLVAVGVGETWRGVGLVTLVVALALRGVSPSLSAAAIADGATGYQRWRHVVLPTIGPALAAVAAFRVLDTYRVLDGPLLADARTASTLTWTTEFTAFELGLGAAMSVLVLVGAGILAAIVVPLFRVRRFA